MSLWLVRHAAVPGAQGLCYGALELRADPIATQTAAQVLAQAVPQGIALVSSPQLRCGQLAQALCGLRPDLHCVVDTRLREMDFGCYEGVPWAAIDKAALDAWTQDFWHHRFGGGESVQAFMQRVAAAWDAWCVAGEPAVWITHAGVIRACGLVARNVRQINDANDWPLAAPGFGQWLQLEAD